MTSSLMCTHENWPELKIVSDKILMLKEFEKKTKITIFRGKFEISGNFDDEKSEIGQRVILN